MHADLTKLKRLVKFSSVLTPSDMIYEETPPIHFGTRTRSIMCNDSTGQLEGEEYLEAASSLSAAWFEGTGLFQHGSYAIGCKPETRENSLILYHAQIIDLSCGKPSYLYR